MYGKRIKRLSISNYPDIVVNAIKSSDTKEECKDKNKKQFKTLARTKLIVELDNNTYVVLYAPKDYPFDGATIPFNIGKGNMKLLYPALFHDIMCDNKWVINYDRQLADTIFLKLLLMHHVNPFIAYIMFIFVEIYQLFRNWRKN